MGPGREAPHVDAGLGDDDLRGGAADPVTSSSRSAAPAKRGDLCFEVDLQRGDVGAGLVDAAKHRLEQEGVMAAKAATEGLLEQGAQAGPRQPGQDLGVAPAGDQRGEHGAAGDPEAVAGDHRQLGLGVPGQLRPPAASFAVRTATRSAR
jgi:hypothetical protein